MCLDSNDDALQRTHLNIVHTLFYPLTKSSHFKFCHLYFFLCYISSCPFLWHQVSKLLKLSDILSFFWKGVG